jgi:hypothetical protein
MVVVAFVLFEVWFFFFSGSPIDSRSGRAALEPQDVNDRARLPALTLPQSVSRGTS